jgi:ribonuclease BN (tRNA processing enzyme)
VTALGSADAFHSAGRGHTCWLIEDAQGMCAVDFGATAMMALKRLGRDPGALQAVHFTHLHGDHIAGWPFLLVDAVYRLQRTAPLLASGPPGTRDRLHALWAACYARAAEKSLPFPLEVRELRPGERAVLAGREVRAFAAQHMTPPDVALSLRIGRLAFTGDTGAIPEGLCDGAELLCAECTYPSGSSDRHLSWDQLRDLKLPMLLGHLGEEARNAIRPGSNAVVCDDLTSWTASSS